MAEEESNQKITPFLWFDDQAEEAAGLYTFIFDDGKILNVSHYGEGVPLPAGTVMTVTFQIEGQMFTALNGGPEFTVNKAISFMLNCKSQAEVDRLWKALTADGGEEGPCGWLKDKFGVSWQIAPTILNRMLQDEDEETANRVMQTMLQMKKIGSPTLQAACDGVGTVVG